jgi:hypothetical protein
MSQVVRSGIKKKKGKEGRYVSLHGDVHLLNLGLINPQVLS